MRMKLKLLRVSHNITQEELAAILGVSRNLYADIENGKADGKPWFWQEVQKYFKLSDSAAWDAMTNIEEGKEA